MRKNKQKDILERSILRRKDVVADVMSALVFQGKRKIEPTDLQEADRSQVYEEVERGYFKEAYRDNIMCLLDEKKEIKLYLAIENFTKLSKDVVVRVAQYNILTYLMQMKEKRKKIVPVITDVFVWNEKTKSGIYTLSKRFTEEIVEEFGEWIEEYKCRILSIYDIPKEDIERLKTQIKQVILFVQASQRKEDILALVESDATYKALDWEFVELINVVTHSEIVYDIREEGGKVDMCKALDDIRKDGIEEGRHLGVEEGRRIKEIESIQKTYELMRETLTEKSDEDIISLIAKKFEKSIDSINAIIL